jgi:cytochrome c556
MSERVFRSAVVLVGLVAVTAVGCATGSKMMVGSGDVIADRQRLMKLMGASAADLTAKQKAGNIEAIAVNAETIAINAQHISSMFPAETKSATKTWAKAEIQQKRADFEAAARKAETLAGQLRDAARAKNAQQVNAMVATFGREACGSCHTPFRTPKQ